jgi:hypothetical protein
VRRRAGRDGAEVGQAAAARGEPHARRQGPRRVPRRAPDRAHARGRADAAGPLAVPRPLLACEPRREERTAKAGPPTEARRAKVGGHGVRRPNRESNPLPLRRLVVHRRRSDYRRGP